MEAHYLTDRELIRRDNAQMKAIASIGKHGVSRDDKKLKRMMERCMYLQTVGCKKCKDGALFCQHMRKISALVFRPKLGVAKGGYVLQIDAPKRNNENIATQMIDSMRGKMPGLEVLSIKEYESKKGIHFDVHFRVKKKERE